MEGDPSQGREQRTHLHVHFEVTEMAEIEAITRRSAESQRIAHEVRLPAPLQELTVEAEGDDKSYSFRTVVRLYETDEDDSRIATFINRSKYLTNAEPLHDNEDNILLINENGFQYIFLVNKDKTAIAIQTAGKHDEEVNVMQRAQRSLEHEHHSVEDSFHNFLTINEGLLTDLLSEFDHSGKTLTIPIRATEPLSSELETELPPHAREIPKLRFDDLGGIEDIKEELMEVALMLCNPEILHKYGLPRPHGLFLYGPPGTGKTTLVEALANELNATLTVVKSSEIYGKWMGESEKNFQAIIDQALAATEPYVLLFDEIDSIIRFDGGSAYSTVAGIFKREIGQLSEQNPNVVVAATSNKTPGEIDEALFRPGRFDAHIYVPAPNEDGRKSIFEAIVSRFIVQSSQPSEMVLLSAGVSCEPKVRLFEPSINFADLAKATDGFTGADINAVIVRAVKKIAMQEIRTGKQTSTISTEALIKAVNAHKTQKA